MPSVTSTFAGQLLHFAQSVDIVDDATFDNVRTLVYSYLEKELGTEYFELLRDESVDDPGQEGDKQIWLRTFWSSEERHHFWPVRGADHGYSNAVARVFDTRKPLWLVNTDRSPLDTSSAYEDQWSHVGELPPYHHCGGLAASTVIAVPLYHRRSLGAYFIETSRYIQMTDVAASELKRLGVALSILLDLYDVHRDQSNGTSMAINDLRGLLTAAKFPKLTKPHFFVASSSRADPAVTAIIEEVLAENAGSLEYTDWRQMTAAGNINVQISREIWESRFGLCYLSEPVPPDEQPAAPDRYSFRDNTNVVFEAGMLHARTNVTSGEDTSEPTGWVPVREMNSPPPPFDFANERILYVPRSPTGELNERSLRESLRRSVGNLLRTK